MTQEYYARVDYLYEGGDANFSIPFPYLNKDHIVAIIDEDSQNPITDLEFLTDNQVKINKEIMSGAIVSIRRITPLDDRFVIFTDGNILDEESQNLSALQVFDVVQEIKDANDYLLNQMTEFLALKNYIDKTLNTLNDALEAAEKALKCNAETRELLNDTINSYEELKTEMTKGVKCKTTHNLFEIITTDKVLIGEEAEGLILNGKDIEASQYADAYATILKEYEEGELKVYTSSDEVSYYKSYTGSVTGNFYTPNNVILGVNTDIYSDTYCINKLGTINAINTFIVDKYNGSSINNFYINQANVLQKEATVYEDELLLVPLGNVTDIKSVTNYKYKGNKSGTFYTSNDVNIRLGRKLYRDMMLSDELGVITAITKVKADKYKISGLEDIEEFYVPSETVLTKGTQLYKDAACTEELAILTGKGSATTNSYCYKIYNVKIIAFDSRGSSTARSIIKPFPEIFYTKEALSETDIDCYTDSACLNKVQFDTKAHIRGSFIYLMNDAYKTMAVVSGSYTLLSQSTGATSNYITLDEAGTKLSYYKQATVEAEVISINNQANETYILEGIEKGNFIKIADTAYQAYNKISSLEVSKTTITIGTTQTNEIITFNGVKTGAGVVFEYKEAENGHKIVSSMYSNQLIGLEELFYIIDFENEKVTTPIIQTQEGIYSYYCVGNTVLVQAGIQGITKSELNNILENYVKNNDDLFKSLFEVLNSYNDTVGNINVILAEILGE